MSRALMVRSIPLSSATRDAWKDAGAMFARRDRTTQEIINISTGRPIINLGSSSFEYEPAWNSAPVVSCLLSPKASRLVFDEMMPDNGRSVPAWYWLKGPGRGGTNKEKTFVNTLNELSELHRRAEWIGGDIQRHIDGTEYRAITVMNDVVQVSKRIGGGDDRNYEWIGTRNAPRGLIPAAKWAATKFIEKTIIGWDLIKDDDTGKVHILEGNASPGVNVATANRILDAVEVL